MKIALKCSNPLLERTLRLFLSEQLCSVKDCDFIISDDESKHQKSCFKIADGGHLALPFSREQLFSALEEFLSTISQQLPQEQSFEQKLDELLERFRKEILHLVQHER